MCSRQLDIEEDGHFATVLIGVGNLSSGEITLANAGHLNPLVLDGSASSFVPTNLGPPLGIAPSDYASFSFTMGPGASFVAFTDGLVERRGESIEVGLQRLARHAGAWSGSPETLVTGLVAGMTASGAEDDVAVLAFQWNPGDR
jgi:serine phosphatase RsbU (regulator of sigma subunit)